MRQTTAVVMSKVLEYDLSRKPADYYDTAGTITGTFIPTGGEIVQKQYGQEYAGEFEFYTKRVNAALLAGNRLQIAGVNYDIVAVRDYIKARTVLLKAVVTGG